MEKTWDFKTWGITLDLISQWVNPAKRYNWIDFTIIDVTVEYSPYKYSNEIRVGLLGLIVVATFWRRTKLSGLLCRETEQPEVRRTSHDSEGT